MLTELKKMIDTRLAIIDRYSLLLQAKSSYYVRRNLKVTAVELDELLEEYTTRLQVMAVQHAAMEDLLRNHSAADRTIEAAKETAQLAIMELAGSKPAPTALDALSDLVGRPAQGTDAAPVN